MTPRARLAAPIVLYAVLAVLLVPVFPHFVSPNEFSRWIVAVAIVDFGTVEATPVINATHTRMEDLAAIDGRLYSNKAPGGALVALPAYAIARAIVGPPSPHNMRATLNAMRLLGATIPAILVAMWVGVVARRFGCSDERALFAMTAMLFGTPLFAYGLLFFAHALSAFTLFGAFALLFSSQFPVRSAQFLAGALIGLAVLSEYPSAIPAIVLIACALPRLRTAGTLRIIAGGLPFAVILGVYNKLAFGSVFTLSSAHESSSTYRELATRGAFGVGLPEFGTLMHLLFDPAKGLFVFSPVLLVAFFGLRAAYRTMPRDAFVALNATPLAIVLTFAGYANWHGGWTAGARYLVAAVPFMALLIAFARESLGEAALLGASIIVVAVVSLVFPFVGREYPAPWFTYSWPILREGFVAPNLLHFVWRPLAVVVPFAIVTIVAIRSVRLRSVPALTAGAALWFATGLFFAHATPPNLRAVVQEAYFGDRGAIERSLPRGARNKAALEEIARRFEQSPPDSWPF